MCSANYLFIASSADLDGHQGDGTAVIFADDATVFTFSMHCSENFPAAKQRSDRDVALPAGTGDARYLRTVRAELDAPLRRSRRAYARQGRASRSPLSA